jgi:hypothetical protein
MGTTSKITGTLATAISKVSGTVISGLANIMGQTISLFSNSAYSLSFDGTNDYVTMGDDSSIKITGPVTYNIWMYRDDWSTFNSNAQLIMTFGPGKGIYTRWKSRRIQAFIYVNSAWHSVQSLTNKFRAGHEYGAGNDGWHMMSIVWDGEFFKLYINGGVDTGTGDNDVISVDIGAGAGQTIEYGTGTEMMLSKSSNADTSYWNQGGGVALLDEASVWNAALDESNLTAIYNSGVPINLGSDSGNYNKSGNLQAWWRFEENTGTSIADSSTNSNTATLVNGTAFSSTVPD